MVIGDILIALFTNANCNDDRYAVLTSNIITIYSLNSSHLWTTFSLSLQITQLIFYMRKASMHLCTFI